jgi:hypothetical protein
MDAVEAARARYRPDEATATLLGDIALAIGQETDRLMLPIWSACPMPAEPCRAFNLFCDCGLVGVLS